MPGAHIIRELPPTRLITTIDTPAGSRYRWASDAHRPEDVSGSIEFSTTMPGGFETAGVTLARDPSVDYPDLDELSTLRFLGVGGQCVGEYRLETSPRTSGDQMQIAPGLTGWQAHLADDDSAREIFVDIDLTTWTGPGVQRVANLAAQATPIDLDSPSTAPDQAGDPSLVTQITGSVSRDHGCEAWYDARGIPLSQVYYAWQLSSTAIASPFTSWDWDVSLGDDDVNTASDNSGNLIGAGPGSSNLFATTGTRKFASARMYWLGGAGLADGINYAVCWTGLVAYGDHGITLQGTNPQGVLSSDVEAYAVGRWAPTLNFSTGQDGTIQPSAFIIPQLAFKDPTTAAAMIQAAAQFELRDWAVWEGPTYYSNARGARGRRWLARSTDCKLQATGPDIIRLFNGAIVTFQDSLGTTRLVGPPGSGADVEDASLLDPDPSNPANERGINRYGPNPPLSIGIGSADSAIAVGAAFLQEQKDLDQSGQAAHVGYIQEAVTGVLFPAWMMRAGDQVSYIDASDRSYRRIVSTSYDDASLTNTVQLDAPPDTLQALLARYSAELTNS